MAAKPIPTGQPRLGEARRSAIIEMLRRAGAVSVTEIQEHLGVSPMTARRDLAELARRGIAQRTHGGAVLPPLSAHEDSFSARLEIESAAKRAIAEGRSRCSVLTTPCSWTPRRPRSTRLGESSNSASS
jgi:DNA-binding IclR family transcriptional regulator